MLVTAISEGREAPRPGDQSRDPSGDQKCLSGPDPEPAGMELRWRARFRTAGRTVALARGREDSHRWEPVALASELNIVKRSS